jgi:hypothetical protein
MTPTHNAERPTSAGMRGPIAAEAGLSPNTTRTLFNELLNLYDGENELHEAADPAFRMDNHRVGVSRQPCRPCRPADKPRPGRLRTPTAARQEWT